MIVQENSPKIFCSMDLSKHKNQCEFILGLLNWIKLEFRLQKNIFLTPILVSYVPHLHRLDPVSSD